MSFKHHLDRLKTALLSKYSIHTVPKWIEENTHLGGMPFSYKDHEYQLRILSDTSREVVIKKCSQIGISELSARLALATANILPSFTVIYTLPTATFGANFVKTRIDPIINESPMLRDSVSSELDNSEVKQFANGSFLWVRGAASNNTALSIPADMLVHDEVDASDQRILAEYQSRLTHSRWKHKVHLSTPTVPDYGIDRLYQQSRRHLNLCKCHHCGEWFHPDYYAHVIIPGFSGHLDEINAGNLHKLRWQEAALHCPRCGGLPSLQSEHREWVCENPEDRHVAAGYWVTPFDAPNIIAISYLVEASTKYAIKSQFRNQNLGIASADATSGLAREDLLRNVITTRPGSTFMHVLGLDVGMLSHAVVFAVSPEGLCFAVHHEVIPVSKLRERRREIMREWNCGLNVIDFLPYSELVIAEQVGDPNLYAAVFANKLKSAEVYVVKEQQEDAEAGKAAVRQVTINRNKALDAYMQAVRDQQVLIVANEHQDDVIAHHTDMKRVQKFTEEQEMQYVWEKSERGTDHWHHAYLYAWVAAKLRGMASGLITLPSLVMKFRHAPEAEERKVTVLNTR